jgi:predicted nucleotidyltransferase
MVEERAIMAIYGWGNCPEPNKQQLFLLSDRLKESVGGNLVGIYVHGSLALGSFNPDVSDLDVIVLLQERIGLDLRYELIELFLQLSNHPSPIEISLITMDAIWPWQHPTPFQLHYSEYWRKPFEEQVELGNKPFWAETRVDPDLACHITLINRHGICLYGRPVNDVFPEVPEEDFRSSILADVQYGASALDTMPVYGILSLCRVLSYLETKTLLSKGQAGNWALPLLPEDLRYMVVQAVDTCVGTRSEIMSISGDDLEKYKNFMLCAIYHHTGEEV